MPTQSAHSGSWECSPTVTLRSRRASDDVGGGKSQAKSDRSPGRARAYRPRPLELRWSAPCQVLADSSRSLATAWLDTCWPTRRPSMRAWTSRDSPVLFIWSSRTLSVVEQPSPRSAGRVDLFGQRSHQVVPVDAARDGLNSDSTVRLSDSKSRRGCVPLHRSAQLISNTSASRVPCSRPISSSSGPHLLLSLSPS